MYILVSETCKANAQDSAGYSSCIGFETEERLYSYLRQLQRDCGQPKEIIKGCGHRANISNCCERKGGTTTNEKVWRVHIYQGCEHRHSTDLPCEGSLDYTEGTWQSLARG